VAVKVIRSANENIVSCNESLVFWKQNECYGNIVDLRLLVRRVRVYVVSHVTFR